jgi:hypothetical protein
MIYYWIFKYILHRLYTKKGLMLAYAEGGAFAIILSIPIATILFSTGYWNKSLAIAMLIGISAIDFVVTWDDEKVERIFFDIERNKAQLATKFLIVKIVILALLATPIVYVLIDWLVFGWN